MISMTKPKRSGPKTDPNRHPLARWRERHNVSLRELARRTGLSQARLSQIEAGNELPGSKAVIALAKEIRRRHKKQDPLKEYVAAG